MGTRSSARNTIAKQQTTKSTTTHTNVDVPTHHDKCVLTHLPTEPGAGTVLVEAVAPGIARVGVEAVERVVAQLERAEVVGAWHHRGVAALGVCIEDR